MRLSQLVWQFDCPRYFASDGILVDTCSHDILVGWSLLVLPCRRHSHTIGAVHVLRALIFVVSKRCIAMRSRSLTYGNSATHHQVTYLGWLSKLIAGLHMRCVYNRSVTAQHGAVFGTEGTTGAGVGKGAPWFLDRLLYQALHLGYAAFFLIEAVANDIIGASEFFQLHL